MYHTITINHTRKGRLQINKKWSLKLKGPHSKKRKKKKKKKRYKTIFFLLPFVDLMYVIFLFFSFLLFLFLFLEGAIIIIIIIGSVSVHMYDTLSTGYITEKENFGKFCFFYHGPGYRFCAELLAYVHSMYSCNVLFWKGGRLCRCFDSMLLEILGPEVSSQVSVHMCMYVCAHMYVQYRYVCVMHMQDLKKKVLKKQELAKAAFGVSISSPIIVVM